MRCYLLAFTSLLAAVPAQTNLASVVAYPNDATSANWGNCFLIGTNTGVCQNSRSQVLVPARFLPGTGGTIIAAEFITFNSSSVTYSLLDITLSNDSKVRLDPNMSNNLPNPTKVFSSTSTTINWQGDVWERITFQRPFTHTGGRGLVVDVAKSVGTQTGNAFHYTTQTERTDLPVSISTNSPTGTIANNFIPSFRLRLVFSDRPTVTLGSDLAATGNRHYRMGENVALTAYGSPNQPIFLALDVSNKVIPTPTTIPGFGGSAFFELGSVIVLPQATIGPMGSYRLTIRLPVNPSLAYRRLSLQAVDVASSRGPSFTNLADGYIQP